MSQTSETGSDSERSLEEIPAGNYYNKHESGNPIARYLVAGFYRGLEELAREVQYQSIHEVGCGEGYLLARFTGRGLRLKGSDLSPEVVDEARTRVRGLDPQCEFQAASIYDLEPETDSADLVLCCEVLEHLENTQRALDVLQELARPYLIVSVPREPIWRILNMARGKYWRSWGNTPGHVQHWSKQGFLDVLKSRFTIRKVVSPLPWTMVLLERKSTS